MTDTGPPADAARGGYLYYRHRLAIRVTHWINVVSVFVLLMSGLQIFNAHPALYWGKSSYTGKPPVLALTAKQDAAGRVAGITRVLGHEFDTTGFLGASANARGELVESFAHIAGGKGGYWEDHGYQWYAGI